MLPFKDDNPTSIYPYVTIGLIVMNVLAFVAQAGQGDVVFYRYGAIPAALVGGQTIGQAVSPGMSVFTSMFMHGGLLHLGGNMLYLWIFGNNIEDVLGHVKFALFYLTGGVVAAYSYALPMGDSLVPMVGASGAVSAVLGAYILLFPRARVHTLIFLGFFVQVVQLPALIVIGFWAIIQMVNWLAVSGSAGSGGIAWLAHIGGFVFGLAAIKVLTAKTRVTRRRF